MPGSPPVPRIVYVLPLLVWPAACVGLLGLGIRSWDPCLRRAARSHAAARARAPLLLRPARLSCGGGVLPPRVTALQLLPQPRPPTVRENRAVEARHELVDQLLRRGAVNVGRGGVGPEHVIKRVLGVPRAVRLARRRVDLEDRVAIDAPGEALVLLLPVERPHADAHAAGRRAAGGARGAGARPRSGRRQQRPPGGSGVNDRNFVQNYSGCPRLSPRLMFSMAPRASQMYWGVLNRQAPLAWAYRTLSIPRPRQDAPGARLTLAQFKCRAQHGPPNAAQSTR
jgi:hypothetical protein